MRILSIIEINKTFRKTIADIEVCLKFEASHEATHTILKKAHYDLRGAYAEFLRLEVKGFDRTWPTEEWKAAPKDYIPELKMD